MHKILFPLLAISLMGGVVSAGSGVWTPHGPFGGSYSYFLFDPTNQNRVWVSWVPAGLFQRVPDEEFRSTNAGESWSPLPKVRSSGLIVGGFVRMSPVDPSIMIAADFTTIYHSTDSGNTWTT